MFFFCFISRGKTGNKQSWVNTDFSFDKITRKSRHTRELHRLLQTSLPWAGKTRNMYVQILLQKVEQLSIFCNNLSEPATT